MEEESLDQFRRYFDQLRGKEHAKDDLIEGLLSRLARLEDEYRSTKMDYEREIAYNRDCQRKEVRMAAELKELRLESMRDPFVLVLLDGDGMVFDESMLAKGEAGGKEAANELWSQTREYIQRVLPDLPPHFKIMARSYANFKGLGDVCTRAGLIRHSTFVEEFARGFTGSKQLFDFVDVGTGKDRADEKITETLRLHINNRSCQHIIFGGSHDNGYARLLEEISIEHKAKITLLEGVPFERELQLFLKEFETVKFGQLFRSSKVTVTAQMISPPHYSSTKEVSHDFNSSATDKSNGKLNGSSSSATSSPQASAAQIASSTWANKVTAATAQVANLTVSPPPNNKSEIPRNKLGQRIDPPYHLPDPNEKQRVAKIKMCNVHYLQHDCPYGDSCAHNHTYQPTKSELDILRFMNRLIPCRNGTACDEPGCMYGHRCQRPTAGGKECQYGTGCRFGPEMHGLDTRVVRTVTV